MHQDRILLSSSAHPRITIACNLDLDSCYAFGANRGRISFTYVRVPSSICLKTAEGTNLRMMSCFRLIMDATSALSKA